MAKNDYDKDGDNDMAKAKDLKGPQKLYGGASLDKSGPARGHASAAAPVSYDGNGSGHFATGPARNDASIGRKSGSVPKDGTKAAAKGEDAGGKASGKRGAVRGK